MRFKGITVFDLIQLATGKKIDVDKACEYLSEVGLCAKDYIRREVNGSLSGGELKRIEIATVMARNTQMTKTLMSRRPGSICGASRTLSVFLKKCTQSSHGNILIISHQERILNIADEIVMIANGELKAVGTKEEILPQIFGTMSTTPSGCGCKYYASDANGMEV